MSLVDAIRLAHTLIFVIATGMILYIVFCGLAQRNGRLLLVSIVIIFGIGASYIANGLECPVATLVYAIEGRRDVADIFLPDPVARNVVPVSAIVYVLGLALVARNALRRSSRGSDE